MIVSTIPTIRMPIGRSLTYGSTEACISAPFQSPSFPRLPDKLGALRELVISRCFHFFIYRPLCICKTVCCMMRTERIV